MALREYLKEAYEHPSPLEWKDVLNQLKNKSICIYGAGSFGQEIYHLLHVNGIEIEAFLDAKAAQKKQLYGIDIYTAQEFPREKRQQCVVLFAIVMDKMERIQVMDFIKECGFQSIIEAQSIRCLFIQGDAGRQRLEAFQQDQEAVFATADLWEDDKSKAIYQCNVYAHLTRDYSSCSTLEDPLSEQYFPQDIPLKRGADCVIDCGGYIGDTVEQLIKKRKPQRIIAFEPDLDNFFRLEQTCKSYSNVELVLFPCAVSDMVQRVSFCANGGSGAIMETEAQSNIKQDSLTNEKVVVLTVDLDSVLNNIVPTLIKMDIEGEELKALYGARKLIERHKPDLAICVYHCVDHLWKIPLLLAEMNSHYRFYLRNYNAYTMETVLYATSDD